MPVWDGLHSSSAVYSSSWSRYKLALLWLPLPHLSICKISLVVHLVPLPCLSTAL